MRIIRRSAAFPPCLRKSSGFLVRRSAATPPRNPSTALTGRKIDTPEKKQKQQRGDHMKVAFTEQDRRDDRSALRQSDQFPVWEMGPDEARFLETSVGVMTTSGDEEDRIAARAGATRRLRHRLHHADRRTGSGQAGGPQDPSHEDRYRGTDCRDRGQAAGGAAGQSAALAAEGDEQG